MPPTGQNPHHGARAALPRPRRRPGTYPFVKLEEAKRRLAAAGRRADRLRQGRSARADRADDPRRRLRTASPRSRPTRSPRGCPSCGRQSPAGARGASASSSTPTPKSSRRYGSKEAIFLLAQMLVDRDGDRRLVVTTEPGYPVPDRGAAFAGADVARSFRCARRTASCPISTRSTPRPGTARRIVWINYPNNPTGAVAPLDFLERLADLSAQARVPARLGRGLHGALVRRAAALRARGAQTAGTSRSSTRSASARR